MLLAINSRNGSYPSVALYCKARAALCAKTLWHASSKRWIGNASGDGRPPANEITPGFSVILSSSRMAELRMPLARRANLDVQAVDMETSLESGLSETVWLADGADVGVMFNVAASCGQRPMVNFEQIKFSYLLIENAHRGFGSKAVRVFEHRAQHHDVGRFCRAAAVGNF